MLNIVLTIKNKQDHNALSSLLGFCNDFHEMFLALVDILKLNKTLSKQAGLAIHPNPQLLGFTTSQQRITEISELLLDKEDLFFFVLS